MTLPASIEEAQRPGERLAYSPDEACELLGVSMTTIRTAMSAGRLAYTTAGGRILISRKAIDDFLAQPPERVVKRPGYPTKKA